MNAKAIFNELEQNREVFRNLLDGHSREMYMWKPSEEKWCLLEVVCHLYDEEREDFRTRVKHVLETPEEKPPPIDPAGWVKERDYMGQDYAHKLQALLRERDQSVEWLKSLSDPKWDNAYIHPKFGPLSAGLFLSNWLAHDYHHIRQINDIRYKYLKAELTDEDLRYAGEW